MAEPMPPSYAAATNDEKYPGGTAPYPSYQSQNPYPPQEAYPPMYTPAPQQQYVYPPPGESAPSYPSPTGYADHDIESGKSDDNMMQGIVSFSDKSVRLGFIRKVFAILALQMSVTIGMTCWFLFHEPTKNFVQEHLGFYIAGYVIFLVLYIVLVCCTSVARKHPVNLVLLALFTLSLGYMVAVISSFYDTNIVLAAFGITVFCCAAVIAFASQTKYDFTACSGILFVLCISLFLFGILAAITVPNGQMRIVNVVYASLGAMLFMAFLAFDTQLIMGGKKYELSPEDYVFGAMMLYVDVIYIFLFILALFGGSK